MTKNEVLHDLDNIRRAFELFAEHSPKDEAAVAARRAEAVKKAMESVWRDKSVA